MGKIPVILVALGVAVVAIFLTMTVKHRKKETWFSRDLNYGRANGILWDRYLAKGAKGVANQEAVIRETYKYPGYGDYTGMMCRGPNNYRCTTYNTFK